MYGKRYAVSDSAEGDQKPTLSPIKDECIALQEKLKIRSDELEKAVGVASEAYQALKNNYLGIIKVFDQLMTARGHHVIDSAKRIAEITKKMTSLLSLSPEEEQHIVFAGFLYNIGKIILPDHILNKPFAALKNEEKIIYKEASVRGAEILSTITSLNKTAFYIRHMHERFDGKGYPDGLIGEKIPLGSRIIALVSDYENLQNGTLTGKKHEKAQAINFILDNRKSRYDPQLANLLIEGQNADIKISGNITDRQEQPSKATALIEQRTVSSKELAPKMILAADLQTKAGISILSKGYEFTEEIINNIIKLEDSLKESLEIPVYIAQEKGNDNASNHARG